MMKQVNKIRIFCSSILLIVVAACLLSACSEDDTMDMKPLKEYQLEFAQYVISELEKLENCTMIGYEKGNFKGTQTEFETKKGNYLAALLNAEEVLQKVELTVADIVEAKGALAAPGKEFTDKYCLGDLRPLHNAILQAEDLYNATSVGTATGQVSNAAKSAFNQVLTAERSLRNAAGTTESHIPGAIARIEAAIQVFRDAIVK